MALVDSYSSIIFDYGGVLARHQSDADQANMAGRLGISPERFTDLYWAKRAEYDKGVLTAGEYWNDVARQGGTRITAGIVDELTALDTASWMQFDDVMWEWVGQLRSGGKRLAMLSNMPRELGEALKTRTRRLALFDQVTLSYEIHAVKPDAAIYEHCLQGLGSAARDSLFFDDRIQNVQGAEMLGMHAIQFLDRDEVLRQMRDGTSVSRPARLPD
jgi:putative hydrolase of the HAD superfamily